MTAKSNASDIDLVLQLAASFERESDRALAILAGSYLDYLLEKLISSELKLETLPQIASSFLFEDHDASLATFSAKIEAAYRMKLIGNEEHRDLHLIRKIRNDFAHELLGVSFQSESVSNRCREMHNAKVGGMPESSREQFQKASARLMVEIVSKISKN